MLPGSGTITRFFLYDVAEAIDLDRVRSLFQSASPTRVAPKPSTPRYVEYRHPPVVVDATGAGIVPPAGLSVRFKLFDYGAISVALSRQLPRSWETLLADGLVWHDEPALTAAADAACGELMERLAPAVRGRRDTPLTEDYLVFALTHGGDGPGADDIVAAHGGTIAQLLRGEREPLSVAERDDVLRHRISYLANDLVVPTWSAAFVYDTDAGAQGVLEILEFANSQLLEFRYYDGLLEQELAGIYALLERPRWPQSWFGRRFTRAARHVHTLFIDVNELTDRTENALKVAGDVYAARLLTLASAPLGLDHWKASVRDKLKTLDDIYRFAVEQTSMARGELLELTIVLILIFELALFFAGVMR